MPITRLVPVKQLALDLENFRTIKQSSESKSIHSMISINPDWFWALMESLLDSGYLPTENVIVQKKGKGLVVREGNRRIGALKIALGILPKSGFDLPGNLAEKVGRLTKAWKGANRKVPCAIYEEKEADIVDRIVSLTHGKGEKAGRDKWNAVAKARHNRDKASASEPALDLLEVYIKEGKNLTQRQAERWGGEYPLSVLEEAIKRLAPRLGSASAKELVAEYPRSAKNRDTLENILRDVGLESLTFQAIRDPNDDFAHTRYGLPAQPKAQQQSAGAKTSTAGATTAAGARQGAAGRAGRASGASKPKSLATNDPRAVMRALKDFEPRGKNREKVTLLLGEARQLSLNKHAHAFCFLLRSMFELSAKAYCLDHKATGGPSATKPNGDDRNLVDVLRDIAKHLTANNTNRAMVKLLHGAITELGKSSGLLSVTSMNQLIHNPRFVVDEVHICTIFSNVFPLLEEMNR